MLKLLRVITNSERSSLMCPRRWAFRYVDGLTTSDNPAPLRMGSLWHLCLAAYYRSLQAGAPLDAGQIEAAVIAPWLEQRRAAVAALVDVDRDALVQEDVDHAALCAGMLRGYVQAWAQDQRTWEIVAVEAQASRVVPRTPGEEMPLRDRTTVGTVRKTRTWQYAGAMDVVVRNRADGRYWLVEHKTTSEVDLDRYLRKLNFDPQIRGYGWIMLDPSINSDAAVRDLGKTRLAGVIYNVARKKLPAVPPLLKGGSALSKARIDTTRDAYMGEIAKHGFNPDDYTDVLDGLTGRVFFAREAYPFTEPELDAFTHDVVNLARAIQREEAQPYHLRQTAVCTGPAALPCPYQGSICLEDGPMARRAFTVMGIRHPELCGDLAEPHVGKQRNIITTTAQALTATAQGGSNSNDPFADVV